MQVLIKYSIFKLEKDQVISREEIIEGKNRTDLWLKLNSLIDKIEVDLPFGPEISDRVYVLSFEPPCVDFYINEKIGYVHETIMERADTYLSFYDEQDPFAFDQPFEFELFEFNSFVEAFSFVLKLKESDELYDNETAEINRKITRAQMSLGLDDINDALLPN